MKRDFLFKSFTIMLVLTASHAFFVEYRKTQVVGYWQEQDPQNSKEGGRFPSAKTDLDPSSISLYRDFFSYDEFHKYLTFKITLDLQGAGDPKKREVILDQALKETLADQSDQPLKEHGIERLQAGLKGLLSQELLPRLAFNLEKKLEKEFEDHESPFQVNLSFSPETHSEFNFNEEFSESGALLWHDGKSLSQKLKTKERRLHEKIFHTAIPSRPGFYQYHGGQITLWYHPKDKKGFIRFRRYMRSPRLAKSRAFIKSDDFRVNIIHLNPVDTNEEGAYKKGRFVTADIYQGFSEEKPKPWLERSETYFGKLLPTQNYERSLAQVGYPYKKEVIETDQLNLHGVVNHEGKEVMFQTQVEKLVYDFKKQEFSTHSKLNSQLNQRQMASLDHGKVQQKIYHNLLKAQVIGLIQGLSLRELYGDIEKGEVYE